MSAQLTCGTGLAARSRVAATLADVTDAMAGILSYHQKSLDVADGAAAIELRRYVQLEERYRSIASLLRSTAQSMEDARGLPGARHDVKVLASAENAAIFGRFVDRERELLAVLRQMIEQDEAMLAQMRGANR